MVIQATMNGDVDHSKSLPRYFIHGIFTYSWIILQANVGKHAMHDRLITVPGGRRSIATPTYDHGTKWGFNMVRGERLCAISRFGYLVKLSRFHV